MVTVFLEGQIADGLEKRWRLNVRTVADALKAIHANTGHFLGRIIKHHSHYVILVDGKPLENTTSLYKKIKKSVHIIPIIAGAIVYWPAIKAAVAFLTKYWTAYAGWSAGTQLLVASLIVIGGYALISYGIHLLVESIMGKDDPDTLSTTSYVFRGPENVADQGSPVPLAYGRLMSGSKVISVSTSSVDKSNDRFMREDLEFSAGSTNIKEGGAMLTRAPEIL